MDTRVDDAIRNKDYDLPLLQKCILFQAAVLASISLYAQPVTILSQDGITVLSEAIKTETTKTHATYEVRITVQTPTEGIYFAVRKNAGLDDLTANRYLHLEIPNETGLFDTKNKYIKGASTNLITADNATVYVIQAGTYKESFTAHVLSGTTPEVHATLLVPVKSFTDISLVRASDAERFAGTSPPNSRMFVYYNDTDTLLTQRDNVLRFTNSRGAVAYATFASEQFILHQNDSQQDSLTTKLDYLNWDNSKMNVRISGNSFELSKTGDFSDAERMRDLQFKDANGNNRFVRLEKIPRNVIVVNAKIPAVPPVYSENGRYYLKAVNSLLSLVNNDTQQVIWSEGGQGSNTTSDLIVEFLGNQYILRIMPQLGPRIAIDDRGTFLVVGDDGNLKLFRRDGLAVWQSNTAGK